MKKVENAKEIKKNLARDSKSIKNMCCCFITEDFPVFDKCVNLNVKEILEIKYNLESKVKELIKLGYKTFISDIHEGIGIYFAEYILEQKKKFPDIKLICSIQSKEYVSNMCSRPIMIERIKEIILNADYVKCFYEVENEICQVENISYMTKNSGHIILFNDIEEEVFRDMFLDDENDYTSFTILSNNIEALNEKYLYLENPVYMNKDYVELLKLLDGKKKEYIDILKD